MEDKYDDFYDDMRAKAESLFGGIYLLIKCTSSDASTVPEHDYEPYFLNCLILNLLYILKHFTQLYE